jgi:hypothetical protein
MRSGQRFRYLALDPEEPAQNAACHQRIHRDQSNLIPPASRGFYSLELLASDRYLEKGMGLMALTGRGPAEIFFTSLRKNSPIPLSSSTANSKPAKLPAPVPSPTPSPFSATPRKSSQALDTLRDLKNFPSPKAVNTTAGPTPKYGSAAFGSLDLPWKPGHIRSAYGAIRCHMFKSQNITDDIFLGHKLLGHKLLGPNASLSVGQSYKDFYIGKP